MLTLALLPALLPFSSFNHRMTKCQKANHRWRLQTVDSVIEAVADSGCKTKSLVRLDLLASSQLSSSSPIPFLPLLPSLFVPDPSPSAYNCRRSTR